MDEKAKPQYPVPEDHTLRVYSAIIGHKPAVVPEAPPVIQVEETIGTAFRRLAVVFWNTLCRQVNETLPPEFQARLSPVVRQIRRGWEQARSRLGGGDRVSPAPRAAAPAEKPPAAQPRKSPVPTNGKANGKAVIARSEIVPTGYPNSGTTIDHRLTLARAEPPAEAQTPWS